MGKNQRKGADVPYRQHIEISVYGIGHLGLWEGGIWLMICSSSRNISDLVVRYVRKVIPIFIMDI